ncbi:hypothetical protein C1645_784790, partial [Glomus cerebriforme]
MFQTLTWKCLENLSLPFLQSLKTIRVPIKVLAKLIENTSGHLIEVSIDYLRYSYVRHNTEIDNERIIRAIYQNCPNLIYLKIPFKSNNISEFGELLIKCQHLKGLHIIFDDANDDWEDGISIFNWDYLFEVLSKSSPNSLFMFKFYFDVTPKLEQLKSFFDNWRGRHPMLL